MIEAEPCLPRKATTAAAESANGAGMIARSLVGETAFVLSNAHG